MRISSFASCLLASPALLFVAPRADQVHFLPKEGSTIAKKFGIEAEFELGDVSLTQNGQDLSAMVPKDVAVSGAIHWETGDQYVHMEGGDVRELVREFKKSKTEWSAMENSGSEDNATKLDGKKVRFKWNADQKHFDVSVVEGEADQKELDRLDVDADYTALLPGKAVSEGDRWDVDAKGLGKVLFPGKSFDSLADEMDSEGDEMGELAKTTILPQLEKLAAGLVTKCTYAGQREVDGVSCGVIKVEVTLDETLDLSELIEKAIEMQAGEVEIKSTIDEASLAFKATGKGELLWDLAAGHAHSFDLATDTKVAVTLTMSIDAQGQTIDMDGSAAFNGNVKWSMATE